MAYSKACMEQREKSMATIICFMILLVLNAFAKLHKKINTGSVSLKKNSLRLSILF